MVDRMPPNWRSVPREDISAGKATGQRFARSLLKYVAENPDREGMLVLQDAIRGAVCDQMLGDIEHMGDLMLSKAWAASGFLHTVFDAVAQGAAAGRSLKKAPARRFAPSKSSDSQMAQVIAFPKATAQ